MKLVVGLGNPGMEHERNRHNVGFMAVDALARQMGIGFSLRKFQGRVAIGSMAGHKVVLLKPETYMNLSGDSVAEAARFYKAEGEDLIVVHDEIDLPMGRLQVRRGGGTAGHNGVTHLAERLGTKDFVRVRVGIGRPEGTEGDRRTARVVGHVLGGFAPGEKELAGESIAKAARAVRMAVEKGLVAAMNEFNRRAST